MQRVRVGDVEVIALFDMASPTNAARVYASAGDALQRYSGYLDAEGQVSLDYYCFLLRADGRTVLVDTGNGPEAQGQFPSELEAAGIKPADIDNVVFTHLHGDHTGYNLDRETGKPLFANARYLVPRGDWDANKASPARSFTRDVEPLEALGVLDLFEGERALTPSLITLPTPGHTPGHTAIVVNSGGQQAYIIGDAFLTQIDVEELEWVTTWDADAEDTVRSRRLLADRIEAVDALVGASHLPSGLGRFVLTEGRRTWRGAVLEE
jgi:glyoxylase-like metal-dependent hydrolase (beta-lactamase superfamily II)